MYFYRSFTNCFFRVPLVLVLSNDYCSSPCCRFLGSELKKTFVERLFNKQESQSGRVTKTSIMNLPFSLL